MHNSASGLWHWLLGRWRGKRTCRIALCLFADTCYSVVDVLYLLWMLRHLQACDKHTARIALIRS
jgi:hypothetical protein